MRRLAIPLGVLALVLVSFALAGRLREELGVTMSVASVQARVAELGWWGPLLFLALVAFRQLFLLPSGVVLSAGGLCFGAAAATALGAGGLVASAVMNFGLARGLRGTGRGTRLRAVERIGPFVIGLATAHPMGPMVWFYWAAGASALAFAQFLLPVLLGAPVRAFAYAFLGSAVGEWGSPRFVAASVALLALILLPLAHPGLRRRLTPPRAT
jgi:uncharacterized membrane protein YdjX (TVP38/TMEM64 family)